MSCSKPVVISFKHESVAWCFKEAPPLVSAFNEEEVCEKIRLLSNDKELCEDIGKKGREWILKYHSSDLVANRLIDVYRDALSHI